MPDRDDDLTRELRDYYQRMAQQPAPDVTGRVMMSADNRATLRRRLTAIGGGVAAAAAVAAVIAVALENNTAPRSAPARPAAPTNSTTPAPRLSASPTPLVRTAPPPPSPTRRAGAARLHRGVGDVHVVRPRLGARHCAPAGSPHARRSCERSMAARPGRAYRHRASSWRAALPSGSFRFADPLDGWVAAGAHLQVTHDGGFNWYAVSLPGVAATGVITDLETAAGVVDAWAIQDALSQGPTTPAALYRSSTTNDSWSTVSGVSGGAGGYGDLSLVGSHGWLVVGDALVYSTTDGTQLDGTFVAVPRAAARRNRRRQRQHGVRELHNQRIGRWFDGDPHHEGVARRRGELPVHQSATPDR